MARCSYCLVVLWIILSSTILINANSQIKDDLIRTRRETPAAAAAAAAEEDELNGMTFGLRTLAGDANALQVGSSIHYKLEIAFPKGLSKLLLEIKTFDTPFTVNRSSLSLYNFSMPYESVDIQYKIPEPKFHLSNKTINVYDRLVLDFGNIKNTGPTGNTMTVCFSVILIRKPKKAKKKHQLHVGIENNNGDITVVAESEITTTSLSYKDDQVFCEVQMVDAPEKIALDSAAIFRFDANLQFRSDPVKIQLNKSSFEYEPDNIVSLGLISVTKLGENFKAIPQEPRYYSGYRNKTLSKIAYGISVLDMNVITNNGEKSRTFTRNPDNIITFGFTVYAMNFKENIDRNVSFTMDLFIGKKSYFTRTFNMTISHRNYNEKIKTFLLESNGNFTNRNVTKGGVTQLKIKSKFDGFPEKNVFTDYSVVVDVSDLPVLPFVPCAARLLNEESGLNLPFVNPTSIKPDRESGNFVFSFGRLHFVKLIDEFSPGDNDVGVEITFRIPFDSTNDSENPIQAKVKITSGAKNEPVTIKDNAINLISVEDDDNQTSIEITTNSSVKWNDLIVKGGVAIDIELDLPSNIAYPDFLLSIVKGQSSDVLPDLNICRFSVVQVSESIPCTCVERETINNERVIYAYNGHNNNDNNNTFKNQASIDFGSISVVNSSEQKIITNFVAMIEEKTLGDGEQSYPIKIDVISRNNILSTDVKYLTISDTIPNTIDDMSIDLDIELLTNKSIVVPGFTTNILIKVLTKPKTMGPFTIEVYSEDETIISVCGLWIHRIGYNMPCVDSNKMAKYDFINYGQNRRATLHFDMITNFGHHHRKSANDERNDNSLEFISMVRISETATGNQTLKIIMTYGKKNEVVIKDLVIPVATTSSLSSKKLVKPSSISLKTIDRNEYVHSGVPKLFYFDIEMENNTETLLTITMDPSNHYKMCSAAIIKVGNNFPCYSPLALNIMPNKFELGIICNTYLHKKDPNENRLKLAFALRPNDNVTPFTPFAVSGMVYVGSRPFDHKNEMSMSVVDIAANNLNAFPIDKGATVEAESNDNIVLKIRERKWIVFNIRIPAFSTGKLKAVVRGESQNDRAILVLYDLQIIHGGQNIPCPFENRPQIQLNSTVNTNQTNIITADLGWFSNFGYTYYLDTKNLTDKYVDDILKIKVLVELTDHPSIIETELYKIYFETHFGNNSYSIQSETFTQIKPSPKSSVVNYEPKLDINIKYKKRMPVLDRNDTFTLLAIVKHLPESNAEPSNPVLRMFTQNFIEIIKINWANTKELPILKKIDEGSTDIEYPRILFNEEFQFNFTVQIDPKNLRGYGRKEIALITPFRMMCQHFSINSDSESKKFPCSIMKHINYKTESSECNVPLGMDSGDILNNQLSASITVSRQYAPSNARPKSTSFWSPSIRRWNMKKMDHYLQINFKRKTRLVRLVFQSIPKMRRVKSYHVNYSYDGKVWFQGTNTTQITYSGEDDNGGTGESFLEKPIETIYVRLVIDSVNGAGKDSENQYIAVKVELYGCYLDSDSLDSSSTTTTATTTSPIIQTKSTKNDFTTHYTDDVSSKNRHISIDPYTNVAYFCDSSSNEHHYFCYYSDSGGNSWTVIGRSIDSFEGFELATGKFYAIDYDRPAYFYSNDGNDWTPIDQESFNTTVTNEKFQRKIIIPRFIKTDVNKLDIRVGNWKVSYKGLNYDDNQHPKALWSKCCDLE